MINVICVCWDSANECCFSHESKPKSACTYGKRPTVKNRAHTSHRLPAQLLLARFTLENRTFQPYKEISPPPRPIIPSSNVPENPLSPQILPEQCTCAAPHSPQSMDCVSLNKGHQILH